MKVSKHRFLETFGVSVIILALYRCAFGIPEQTTSQTANDSLFIKPDTVAVAKVVEWGGTNHPIYSVPRFQTTFPDSQQVHIAAAEKYGVSAVADRREAESRKRELVYIGSSPYYDVDDLKSSIPYLVPRASNLLSDIGRSYFDSLYVKGIPLHKFIITSALRTVEDVSKLRTRNNNATENSCHLYGTTIDIAQNRYKTVEAPGEHRREVQNDTLKWVLAEVLRDFREQGRCYVKYEVRQGCFHITVR